MRKNIARLLTVLSMFAAPLVSAFPVPGKPVRVIVGVPAGGGTDVTARLVADKLRAVIGVPVVVENRPGVAFTLAALEVARAAPDGHTLLYTPDSVLTLTPHVMEKVGYDPIKSFTPISIGARGTVVLAANTAVPTGSVSDLMAYARAHPGELSYASSGTGTSFHLYGEMLSRRAKVNMVHIPYKGAGDVGKDIVAGRVQLMFAAGSGAVQFARSGRVKIVGLAAAKRTDLLPDVPTLGEQGFPGFDIETWLGWFGPAQMKPEVVEKLNGALRQALANPGLQEPFNALTYEVQSSSPAELATLVKDGHERWRDIVKNAGPLTSK